MKNRTLVAIPLKMGLLLVPLACGIIDPSRVLQPNELCSDHSEDAIVTFEDANLEAGVREDLTCGLLSGKTAFGSSANIRSLGGIQNLTSLTILFLSDNSITDISPLSGLTSLTELDLDNNSITDISPLSGLTSLETLFLGMNSITDISALSGLTSLRWLTLWYNSITDISALSGLTKLGGPSRALTLGNNPNLTDIQPLLDNTGLGAGDTVVLESTSVSCTDVAALEAKGVRVTSDCP